jgi:hypothetical protein
MYTHTVAVGDSLTSLAKAYTGNPNRYVELVLMNSRRGLTVQNNKPMFTRGLVKNEKLNLPPTWGPPRRTGLSGSGSVSEGTKQTVDSAPFNTMQKAQGISGAQRTVTGLGDTASDAQSAATAVAAYLTGTNGCDCSAALCALTTTFQNNYNAGVSDGTYPGPALTVDGMYGTDCVAAFNKSAHHTHTARTSCR